MPKTKQRKSPKESEEKTYNKVQDKVAQVLLLMTVLVIIASSIGLSSDIINSIEKWSVSIVIGIILSAVSSRIVERISGDWLKGKLLIITIWNYRFSISLFTIATFIVQKLLFGW